MKKKNIFILLGNEDKNTFTGSLADMYEKGAKDGGHEVRRMNIGEMDFDPLLHKGYKEIQELEPDLIQVQENMKWCDHYAIFYPNWWGSMPAIFKGMFDRMFLPGFAFRFKKKGFLKGLLWTKLLKGRSACVWVTLNTPPWFATLFFGDNTNEIEENILEFAGFSPVRVVRKGPVERMRPKELDAMKRDAYKAGRKGR